jgi:hypothetical protein
MIELDRTRHGAAALLRKFTPAIMALIAVLAVAAVYCIGDKSLYRSIIMGWSIEPFDFPFLDTDTVLSALRCQRLGVDVYVTNPCDPLNRVYDYSPLWMSLARFPVTTAWIAPVGAGWGLAFLLSLCLLPAGRTWLDTALITLGCLSSATVFAVERGNNDLVIFTLAAAAAALAGRSRGWRFAGYGLALLAGLLKYYPLALMALAVRERPKAFAAVALVSVAAVASFIALDGHDLARALALIPTGSPFTAMFGAKTLPSGLVAIMSLDVSPGAVAALELTLIAAALGLGGVLGRAAALRADLAALTAAEQAFLLTGALLILSCFLTAQNIGYRAIHLILLLPGLLALRRVTARPAVYTATVASLFVLLWAEGWDHWLALILKATGLADEPSATIMVFAWLLREEAWWWTITLLAALVTSLLLHAEMGRTVTLWLNRPRAVKGERRSPARR